jgi:hypothetical protein
MINYIIMNMTIIIILGIFFSTIFVGMMMYTINDKTIGYEAIGDFVDIQSKILNNTLTIAWETKAQTQGTLVYNFSDIRNQIIDSEFKRIHSLKINNVNDTVEFYIEACVISGECVNSEKQYLSFP